MHGKAGFAPDFEGGKTLAAAFGGSIPEVMWDGLTTAPGSIVVNDAVGVMSLGYTKQGQGVADAKPSLVKIASKTAKKRLPKVMLPKEMEARAK